MDEMPALFGQELPYNLEAEQSVLGAILIDPSCISSVLEYITPDCFYRPQNRQIFSTILRMFTAGQTIDFVTLLEAVKSDEIFDSDEDAKVYLVSLAQIVPTSTNVEAYAKLVAEKYYLRRLITASQEIIENSQSGHGDASNLLDYAEQKIFDIRQGRDSQGLQRIDEIIIETYDRLQKLSGENKSEFMGVPSGFTGLDNITVGLNKSDLILLAARPAMGKTSFALNIAANVAVKSKKKVAIFSLEMTKEQLVSRMLSSEASISSMSLRTGDMTSEEWVRLAMTAQNLAKAKIYIDDTSGMTVAQMKAKLRRIKDLGLVVIDYLQLMSSGRRNDNRVVEISEITRNLKIMAKELDVPIITLSQLSRGPEARTDHRPILADLRESGSIEQDSDIVLFLYRDAYYNRESEEQNVAECIVSKNRHGETGVVKLAWDGQYTRFGNLELFRSEP